MVSACCGVEILWIICGNCETDIKSHLIATCGSCGKEE